MQQTTRDDLFARLRHELAGCYFSTAKELRHLAERAGFPFVAVDVVSPGELEIHMLLRPQGIGEVHVRAEREQHWHPFYIRSVELAAQS